MKRLQSLLLLGSGIAIGFLCGTQIPSAYSDTQQINYEQPVARIGDTVITRGQLAEQAILSAGKRLMKGDLQTQALVKEVARRAGVTVSNEEVNFEVETMISFARDSGAEARLREVPRFILEDRARTILLATKMMKINITPEEARGFYMKNPKGFVQPAVAKLICIATPSRTKATDVLRRLNKGEGAKAIAELMLTDPGLKQRKGEIGWVTRSQLGGEADAQIFDANNGAGLKPGQWTDVIAYEYVDATKFQEHVLSPDKDVKPADLINKSYAVFVVQEIHAAYVPKFQEIQEAALYAARMAKYNEQVPRWLAQQAAVLGKEWQVSTNLLNPYAELRSYPLDPEFYFKGRLD